MAESLPVGRNFVSGICMLKSKKYIYKPVKTCSRDKKLSCGAGSLVWHNSPNIAYKQHNTNMKKALGETQTLRAGCSKVEPKIFALPQTPLPEARDGQNLISWRWSLPLPMNPVWWGSMHGVSSYRGHSPTNKQTEPQTHKQTGPITMHCAAKLSAQCKKTHTTQEARSERKVPPRFSVT